MSQTEPGLSQESERENPFFKTVPLFTPKPITAEDVPQHPHLAPNGTSNVHNDAYMTDTYNVNGPLGGKLRVRRVVLGGLPISMAFDSKGRINTVAISASGTQRLALVEPDTLRVIASDDTMLPSNPSPRDFGGGVYLCLNKQDQLLVPTSDLSIMVIEVSDGHRPNFNCIKTYDLRDAIEAANGASCDDECIQSALPDWDNRLWFVTKYGIVGYLDEQDEIHTYPLIDPLTGAKEHIGNSFAIDETGPIYVVSEYALYSFGVGADGSPEVIWREIYDRGTGMKQGQKNFGSGTTPTLTNFQGKRYVSIADNAEAQMNVCVYRAESVLPEGQSRKVCQQPVFDSNASCSENSLVGANNSLVVENNYGYEGPKTTAGSGTTGQSGVSRVDFDPEHPYPEGTGGTIAWTNDSSVPSVVSKLSLTSGLIYTYTKKRDGWYFTAIDFSDGATVYEARVGVSIAANSHYAGLFLGPDGRTAYVGTLEGIISVTQV
jgi:hypothetical protein